MLGKSLASPSLTSGTVASCCLSPDICRSTVIKVPDIHLPINIDHSSLPLNLGLHTWKSSYITRKRCHRLTYSPQKWKLQSAEPKQATVLVEDDEKSWAECKNLIAAFGFTDEEVDTVLKKAFGWAHSPYWGEERAKQVPNSSSVSGMLDYLRNLGMSDEDIRKVLKKFPEVLGCDLDREVKYNVGILEKEWGIKGKALRSLLLRNPKVLGYNVDCKGDCMAQCTRCWVRF